ncbi:hypothetical protein A5660_20575 [Mycobacterium alsense]|uniref:serine/threonine-protein kinase PknD n=1 Tax=Mycobacterium alsense TaxID=324058 RepID=UPI0007FF4F9E|nr:serine/threonine-protein kinase PknD [Mycobacterium alsense]OBJ03342.1 hypothetical protein A5660_20575 [Mycobacterium alsense]
MTVQATFGRYRLLSLIGEGGMGKVYRAHDTVMGRDVAIKVLPLELGAEPGYRERFRREAHTAARLAEPHIVHIYDTGEIDGQLYLVMPIIEGVDVQELLRRDGPMSPQRAVRVIEQLADALHAAHAVGLVHRDVKPSNALVAERDFVYLIDFGIAHDAAATKLTRTGTIVGSWAYMAPERFTSGMADARADIYALACVLYECLTAAQPYPGDSLEQQFTGHYSLAPPKPTEANPALPAGFDGVIARGMAKDPRQRYQSAQDLAAAANHALTTISARAARNTPTARETPPPAPTPPAPRAAPPAKRPVRPRLRLKWPAIAAAAVVTVVAAVAAATFLLRPASPASHTTRPGPVPGQTASPATSSGQDALPFAGLKNPSGIAADGAGDVYVCDAGDGRVLELAAGSDSPAALPFIGSGAPAGVAVNASRTVYVIYPGNNPVLKLAAGSNSPTELPVTGLDNPRAVAVDSADNLYLIDGSNRVLKLPAGSTDPIAMPFTGLSNPGGVAVDGAGAVYVTDGGRNRVLKLTPGAGSPAELPFTALNNPAAVAVDPPGDVYVVDRGNDRVVKLAAGAHSPAELPSGGLNNPTAAAVDGAGNVYVTDAGNNRVVKLAS